MTPGREGQVGLGKKAYNSRIDRLLYQNMNEQVYRQRICVQETDFSRIMEVLAACNRGRVPEEKLRFSAVMMRAIALACDHVDGDGRKPFRRFSGYTSGLPWGGSWESETIDISLMILRAVDGDPQQTCPVVFREVERKTVASLSRKVWEAVNLPEDEVPGIRMLKQIAALPPALTWLLLKCTKVAWIKARVIAPTSLSILPRKITWFQGEHTSYFGLPAIDPQTHKANLEWTYDHRLGMGKDIAGFLETLTAILEVGDFVEREVH